jgi:hypothetical protein
MIDKLMNVLDAVLIITAIAILTLVMTLCAVAIHALIMKAW